jgi:AcrR family transcriptional regulator
MTPSSLAARALTSARAIIEETGDESQLTMRGLARRVGVAAPSLYECFDGIESVRRRVVQDVMAAFLEATASAPADPEPTVETVRRFAEDYVRFGREHPQLYRLLFTRLNPSEMPDVGNSARSLFSRLIEVLAHATGRPVETPESLNLAITMWLELHGIASLPSAHPRFPWPTDATLIDSLVRRITAIDD